jgi:seryl-tRNA synthetase
MEEFFLKSRQKEVSLNLETKKKSEYHFKVVQELHSIKIKEKNLEAELNGCEASLKNLENRINKLDHEYLGTGYRLDREFWIGTGRNYKSKSLNPWKSDFCLNKDLSDYYFSEMEYIK